MQCLGFLLYPATYDFPGNYPDDSLNILTGDYHCDSSLLIMPIESNIARVLLLSPVYKYGKPLRFGRKYRRLNHTRESSARCRKHRALFPYKVSLICEPLLTISSGLSQYSGLLYYPLHLVRVKAVYLIRNTAYHLLYLLITECHNNKL